MSTLTEGAFPSLANWAKRQDPKGGIADIINVMSKENPLLDDIPWQEGNLPTGHRITHALALPSMSWRLLNRGVAATKADVEQFDEVCGIMEDESKVDVDLAKLNGDAVAYRASEDKLKKEGFAQQAATAVFYENAGTNPERIHGLSARYPSTAGYTSSPYVFTGAAGNSGSNCRSIWLLTWELRKLYGIYPKGSMMGLQVEDKGEQRVLDSSSNAFWAYVTKMQWKWGLAVEDYRYAVRFQWDADDATMDDAEKGLILGMQKAMGTIYKMLPSSRFYMDRTTKIKLNAQLSSNKVSLMTNAIENDRLVERFMGVQIRTVDALTTEDAVATTGP